MSKQSPNSVEVVHRSVIEGRLLTALEDKSVVACLFSQQDLNDVICALQSARSWGEQAARHAAMAESLEQLKKEAFGL